MTSVGIPGLRRNRQQDPHLGSPLPERVERVRTAGHVLGLNVRTALVVQVLLLAVLIVWGYDWVTVGRPVVLSVAVMIVASNGAAPLARLARLAAARGRGPHRGRGQTKAGGDAPRGTTDGLAAPVLGGLVPGIGIGSVPGRGGSRIGVVHDGHGWAALLELGPEPGPLEPRADGALPLTGLVALLSADPTTRIRGAQLVILVAGASTEPMAAEQPQPPGSLGAGEAPAPVTAVPLARTVHVVLRFDRADLTERALGTATSVQQLRQPVRRRVEQAVEVLRANGSPARPLGPEEARDVLARAVGLAPVDPCAEYSPGSAPGGRGVLAEGWSWLRHGVSTSASFQVIRWPAAGLSTFVATAATLASAAQSVTVSVGLAAGRHADERPVMSGLIRVAADDSDELARLTTLLLRSAAAGGWRLGRLGGRQAPAAIAALPLGRLVPVRLPGGWRHEHASGDVALATHRAPASAAWWNLPAMACGFVLGVERQQVPVVVRMFRRQPTTIGMFGSDGLARAVVEQALASGATVRINTHRAECWAGLRQPRVSDGQPARLAFAGPRPAILRPGPLLLLDEMSPHSGNQPSLSSTAGWQARIVRLSTVTSESVRLLASFDFLLLSGKLPADAVEAVRIAARLPESACRWLPLLPDNVIALVVPGEVRFVTIVADTGDLVAA
ncbi:hypothetical protein [Frankia sp. CIT1]|uniref:hypothetical protein n=1 Tax=Frankia sp. CIT1 TaxID=2880974 RepID=UPI001EF67640|nr:hypothetical protein [Frankia sp. CIT1]